MSSRPLQTAETIMMVQLFVLFGGAIFVSILLFMSRKGLTFKGIYKSICNWVNDLVDPWEITQRRRKKNEEKIMREFTDILNGATANMNKRTGKSLSPEEILKEEIDKRAVAAKQSRRTRVSATTVTDVTYKDL